ncbi:hypothetical protein LCM23_23175 [Cytobacillus kochii]|nr:hypothetical protein [Cytobacillus kochii]MCA1028941.1 hypothetical protein [Cytobacillus kochii]
MSESLVYALQKRVKKERELRARGVYAQKRAKKIGNCVKEVFTRKRE